VLPTGWIVVESRMSGDGVVADGGRLERLSRSGPVIGCDGEEHVMYSAASEWREGRETWSVVHSSEEARDHLAVKGTPPDGWTKIRDEFLGMQRGEPGGDVDYVYEIPLTLAERVVGYRSDSEAAARLDYVRLVSSSPRPRWRSWIPAAVVLLILAAIVGLAAWRLRLC
jgi:hypothetical protein